MNFLTFVLDLSATVKASQKGSFKVLMLPLLAVLFLDSFKLFETRHDDSEPIGSLFTLNSIEVFLGSNQVITNCAFILIKFILLMDEAD